MLKPRIGLIREIHVRQIHSFIFQVSWLNEYHEKCREVVGEELKNQNKTEVLDWLMKETQPIG